MWAEKRNIVGRYGLLLLSCSVVFHSRILLYNFISIFLVISVPGYRLIREGSPFRGTAHRVAHDTWTAAVRAYWDVSSGYLL